MGGEKGGGNTLGVDAKKGWGFFQGRGKKKMCDFSVRKQVLGGGNTKAETASKGRKKEKKREISDI